MNQFTRQASVVALACIFVTTALSAQQSVYSGFEPNDDYQLEVNGTIDPKAEIYLQRRLPAFLVLPAGSNSPYILQIRGRVVQSVSMMKMTKNAAGGLDLSPDAVSGNKGALGQDSGDFSFTADGSQYRLVEKPSYLGLGNATMLEEYADSYRDGAAAYTPDADAMATIRDHEGKIQVRTYFGSWCPFCKRYVPNIVRVAKEIDEPNITIDFYGLPKKIGTDPVADQARVRSVPTGVVFVDGKEVGRLTQNDWTAPEKSIAKILERAE